MEKVNLLRKAFEGEHEPISHFITQRSKQYIALYNQFSGIIHTNQKIVIFNLQNAMPIRD